MQRLHADDLVAHVKEHERWDVLSFPAIAEHDEIHEFSTPYGLRRVHRKERDVLQPALVSRATLEQLRSAVTNFW